MKLSRLLLDLTRWTGSRRVNEWARRHDDKRKGRLRDGGEGEIENWSSFSTFTLAEIKIANEN